MNTQVFNQSNAFKRITRCLGILSLLVGNSQARAVPSTDPEAFHKKIKELVLPHFEGGEHSSFFTFDGQPIHWSYFEALQPKATVLFMVGAGDNRKRNAEAIYDLVSQGYDVFTYDPRGQGQNQRLGYHSEMVHMENFKHHVKDLEEFISQIVNPQKRTPHAFAVAVSMSGATAASYASQHSDFFKGLFLVAPMIEMYTPGWQPLVAYSVVSAACTLGKCKDFAPGQAPWAPSTFDTSEGISDPVRWQYTQDFLTQEKTLRMAGKSAGWVREALEFSFHLNPKSVKLKLPTVLFQAAKDVIVKPEPQRALCVRSSNCELALLLEAKHDIFHEHDSTREAVFQKINKTISELSGQQ
jgi:lysophospholipase